MANELNQEALQIIQKALTEYGTLLVKNLKLAVSDHRASGALEKSIEFSVTVNDNVVSLQVTALDYLQWLDQGRKPGKMPPVDSIFKWVKKKGLKPRQQGLSKSKRSLQQRQMGLAFAIAKSIEKKGIKPTNLIEPAVEKTDAEAWDALEQAIANAMEFGIKTIIESIEPPKGVTIKVLD